MRTTYYIGLFAFLILAFGTANNYFPTRWNYSDEAQHLANIELIRQYGTGRDFLLRYTCTPGPVYAYVQYFLAPITAGDLARMRLVNIAFLGVSILLMRALVNWFWPEYITKAPAVAFAFMFVPVSYIAAGLALTEFCSITFLLFGLWILTLALDEPNKALKFLWSSLAGLSLGFSIGSRQPFIVVLPMLFMFGYNKNQRPQLAALSVVFIAALIFPLILYSIWGGWVSPFFQEKVAERFWAPEFGLLAFSYASLFMFFISPKWFLTFKIFEKNSLNIGILASFIAINYVFKFLEFLPNKALAWEFPLWLQNIMANFFGGATAYLAFIFIKNFYINWHKFRFRRGNAFLYACAFFLLFSCVKNTLMFGSRYLLPATPFLILLAVPSFSENKFIICLRLGAVALGMVSLWLTLGIMDY